MKSRQMEIELEMGEISNFENLRVGLVGRVEK